MCGVNILTNRRKKWINSLINRSFSLLYFSSSIIKPLKSLSSRVTLLSRVTKGKQLLFGMKLADHRAFNGFLTNALNTVSYFIVDKSRGAGQAV